MGVIGARPIIKRERAESWGWSRTGGDDDERD